MILKLLGGFLLVCSCWLIGYSLSLNLRIRKQSLQDIRAALTELKNQMGFMNSGLAMSFAEIGSNLKTPAGKMFTEFSKQIGMDRSVHESWNSVIDSMAYDLAISQEDKRLLQGFGKMLGNSDIEGQLSNIELTASRLDRQISEATDKEKRLGTIYKYAGAAAGLALTFLLI